MRKIPLAPLIAISSVFALGAQLAYAQGTPDDPVAKDTQAAPHTPEKPEARVEPKENVPKKTVDELATEKVEEAKREENKGKFKSTNSTTSVLKDYGFGPAVFWVHRKDKDNVVRRSGTGTTGQELSFGLEVHAGISRLYNYGVDINGNGRLETNEVQVVKGVGLNLFIALFDLETSSLADAAVAIGPMLSIYRAAPGNKQMTALNGGCGYYFQGGREVLNGKGSSETKLASITGSTCLVSVNLSF